MTRPTAPARPGRFSLAEHRRGRAGRARRNTWRGVGTSGIAALVVAVVALAAQPQAHAYSQWQLSSGSVRCSQCHFAPAGGGLLTQFGRDAMGDDLSTFGGNGRFLHGAAPLPAWLAVGGDLRGAYVAQAVQDPAGAQQAVFPMQADLLARISVGDFSLNGTGGLRGQSRSNVDLVPDQNFQPLSTSRLISREHYLMWRPATLGPYARAGRFYAPFGLRLAEHILYVRRDLGFNQLEESYNLSFGQVQESGELHITAFFPDVVRHIGGRTSGLVVYAEHRLGDDAAVLGAQAKIEIGDGVTRAIGGLVAKGFAPALKTLFFAETDGVRLMTAVGDSNQFVGAAGASLFPWKGTMLTLIGERRQTDLRVRDTATNAATALINWLPYAHVEIQVMGRLQFPAGGDVASTFLAQLHYTL